MSNPYDPYGEQPQNPYGQPQNPYGQPGQPGQPQNPYGQQFAGQPYPGQPMSPPPANNLVWGILTTLFCCLPLGVVSIVKASQVNSLWAQGQFDAAHRSAEEAKKWAMWAAIIGVVGIVAYFVLVVGLGVFSASVSSSY